MGTAPRSPLGPGSERFRAAAPRRLLAAERAALDFLQRLSGVATTTRRCADALAVGGTRTRLLDTRKTTPGWRILEKEAIAAGADLVLLDNMDDATIAEAVRTGRGRVLLEASGNMTPERLPSVAATRVDFVSMGALTHSARAVDISFELRTAARPRRLGLVALHGRARDGAESQPMPEAARQRNEEMVLAFLAESGEEFVSGEAISDKLGLSRAAVWKHVNALRAQGYRIEAVPARGYRLVEIPDRLGELELHPLLNTHDLGQVLHWFEEVGSTNDVAKQLAEEGAAHGEVVIAERQTAGRGRRGRSWTSPPGRNVAMSVVLRPDLPPSRAPELTLVASVAVCQAIRQAGIAAAIKWPNDVLSRGRKVAGILTEMAADPDQLQWIVVGIGVNVNARPEDFPDDLRESATSLAIERSERVPRALFAAAMLTALEDWLDRHASEGFAPVRAAWKQMSETLGRTVCANSGGDEIAGVAEDIDEMGALLIRTEHGVRRVVSGDVTVLRAR